MNQRPLAMIIAFLGLSTSLALGFTAERVLLAGTAHPPSPSQCCPAPPSKEHLELPTPVISIRVLAPAVTSPGADLEYRILVENRSAAEAHHVTVHDAVPTNAKYVRATPEPDAKEPALQWRFGTLEPGAKKEIRLVLSAAGPGDIKNCARVTFEHGQCVVTKLLQPALSVSKRGPTEAVLGERLTYQVTVTNTGPVPAHNVVLTDSLPEGLEHATGQKQLAYPLGSLGPNESKAVSYQVVAKAKGRLCNKAVATADGGIREEIEACVTVAEPKLTLAKTGPKKWSADYPVTYQLTAKNSGDTPLRNVVLIDRLPARTTFLSASAGGRLVGSQVQWALGALEPGAERTVELQFKPLAVGELINQAEATADSGVRALAQARTEIVGAAGLLLEVVDQDDPVEVGKDTRYDIIVRNQGSVPASNIRITATAPEELAIVRVQGPVDHKKDGQKITYDPLTLPPRTDTVFRVYVRALKPATALFRVEMTADLLSGPVREEESTNLINQKNPAEE